MDRRSVYWPYEVRWARKEEWMPAMDMIWRTFLQYEGRKYPQAGIENFFHFIAGEELYGDFLRGEYLLMVALEGERVVGAGSVRDRNYLSLLFVESGCHGKGIGSAILGRLCDYLRLEAGERRVWLEADAGAVGFYQKQGFRAAGPETEAAGIRLTVMEKLFEER